MMLYAKGGREWAARQAAELLPTLNVDVVLECYLAVSETVRLLEAPEWGVPVLTTVHYPLDREPFRSVFLSPGRRRRTFRQLERGPAEGQMTGCGSLATCTTGTTWTHFFRSRRAPRVISHSWGGSHLTRVSISRSARLSEGGRPAAAGRRETRQGTQRTIQFDAVDRATLRGQGRRADRQDGSPPSELSYLGRALSPLCTRRGRLDPFRGWRGAGHGPCGTPWGSHARWPGRQMR